MPTWLKTSEKANIIVVEGHRGDFLQSQSVIGAHKMRINLEGFFRSTSF